MKGSFFWECEWKKFGKERMREIRESCAKTQDHNREPEGSQISVSLNKQTGVSDIG